MRPPIIFAFAMAAAPALAQPRLEVPVTITATEALPTPFCFFFFCGLSLGAVPDGAGGYVPFTNSRVMPDGSLRPYDPAIDGMPSVGPYPALEPMPGPPTAYYAMVAESAFAKQRFNPTKCSQTAYSACLHDVGPYCRKEAASEPAPTRAVEHTACLARYRSTCREIHCD
jgi:hypothetical protein